MPTIVRYRRDPEAKRRAILDAARALFVREGYANVSIRRIAERIDYSAAAIYLHFEGKGEILLALAEEGLQRFASAVRTDPDEADLLLALEQRFWRHYEFSKKQPEYFWLIFVDRAVPRIGRDWERLPAMRQARADGVDLVRRCIAAGLLPRGTHAEAAFEVLETAIHGAAINRLCGRVGKRRDGEAAARDTLRAAIAGLRAGVALEG